MTVTDTLTGRTRTKDYVGSCEFVNDNGVKKTYTYLMGPYGVFAMVVSSGGNDEVFYVYKDHLGSWTTITDSIGTVVERKSFDAWGNRRDPSTWTGTPSRPPKFDRGFTGHEHLYDFGLINMNGRMYDPLLSSFLSPDNYMQDPTSQQGFNRYAYCMYNPLKYVDPTGERPLGWVSTTYQYEQMARRINSEWQGVYDDLIVKHRITLSMANSIYSEGSDACGAIGANGGGNHGSGGGGDRHASTSFNELNHNQCLSLTDGLCVLTSLGIIYGGDDSKAWERRALAYMSTFQKNPFDPNNIVEFINWNPDPDNYHSYECEEIAFTGIYDAMNDGYVVSFMCDFTEEMVNEFGLKSKGHFVNLSYIDITESGCITIRFNDHPLNNYFIEDYKSCISNMFWKDAYQRFMYYINRTSPIMEAPRVIKTRIKKTIP